MSFFKKILSSLSGRDRESAVIGPSRTGTPGDLDRSLASVDDDPEVRLTNLILSQALDDGAVEIHLVHKSDVFEVCFLVGGEKREVMSPPARVFEPVLECLAEIAGAKLVDLHTGVKGRGVLLRGGRDLRVEIEIAGHQAWVRMPTP